MELKKREIKDAIVISPKQVKILYRFLELTENKLKEDKNFFTEFSQDFSRDISFVDVLKAKVSDIAAGKPRAFTLFEGIILTSLTMTFRLNHYDSENLTKDIETIGERLDTLFHEKGCLELFYIVKEDRLEEQ